MQHDESSEGIIIEHGIRVYENHFCLCGCGRRIIYREYHLYNCIPRFINGHNSRLRIGKYNPMFGKHHTKKAKEKLSKAFSGKYNPMYGKRGKKNPNFGKHYKKR